MSADSRVIETAPRAARGRILTLALIVTTFLWSTNYLLALGLQDVLSPAHLTFLRWGIAAPFLLVAAWRVERPVLRVVGRDLPRHLLMAATGIVGYNLLNYAALHLTGPADAAVVNSANPLLIALLAWVVLRQPLGRRTLIGLGLSTLGILIVLSRGSLETFLTFQFGAGELLVLIAGACWAVYSVTARLLRSGPITAVAVQAVIAALALLPFYAAEPPPTALAPEQLLQLALIVVFPTTIAFVLWNVCVARVGPARAGIAINLMPVFTTVMAVLVGVQVVSGSLLVGGACVLGGVVVATFVPRSRGITATVSG
ncbi:MAG: DMT family transporter [Herbiconiux sp.]|nr:DMT family transporter [Herbiconiux sp.]